MSDADALDHGYAGLARSNIGGSISPLSSSDHSHSRHGNSLRHAKAHTDAEYETTRIPPAHRPSGHSYWRCLRSSGSGRIAKPAPIGHRHAGSRRSDDRRRYARCGTMPDMTRLVVDGPVLWQRQILPAPRQRRHWSTSISTCSHLPCGCPTCFQRAAGAISFLRRGPTRQFGRESIDARSLLDSPKMIHNRVHFWSQV